MADRVSFGDGTFVKSAAFSADGNVLAVLYNPTSTRSGIAIRDAGRTATIASTFDSNPHPSIPTHPQSDDPKNACVLWDVSAATQVGGSATCGGFACGGGLILNNIISIASHRR